MAKVDYDKPFISLKKNNDIYSKKDNSIQLKKSILEVRKWVSLNSLVPVNIELITYESTNVDNLLLMNEQEHKHLINRNNNYHRGFSSLFAYRIHPVTGLMDYHRGIDIPIKEGSSVYAYDTGIINNINENIYSNAGKYISILHSDGMNSFYMHLSKVIVKTGQIISKGDLIGYSGSTGRTTGPHLHFELRKNNIAINPLLVGDAKCYIKNY